MPYRTLVLIVLTFLYNSCVIFKTHHKDKLIDFKSDLTTTSPLKLNGYYYTEEEKEYAEYSPPFIDEYISRTGVNSIKSISVLFLYKDGFVIEDFDIKGLSPLFCAKKQTYENTYKSAHESVELKLEAQYSIDKATMRSCNFSPKDVGRKGLFTTNGTDIKIQYYRIERQDPTKDSFNSAYLYELNGHIVSDSSFVITSKTEFRTNRTTSQNMLFQFRKSKHKPNVNNYFITNRKRFR